MFRYIYICLISVALLVVSCKGDQVNSYLELSTARVDARFVNDTLKVDVKSNYPWRATCDALWVEVIPSADGTTLEFLLKYNFDKNSRQAHITVLSEGHSVTLLVSQGGLGSLPEQRVRDSMALINIYEQCGGDDWSFWVENKPVDGWNLSAPFENWRGVSTTRIDGVTRVTGLDLGGVGLRGVLPPQIHWLDQLQVFILADNEIVASPFDILAHLPRLVFVDLSYNPFRFTLPLELGSLTGLNYLYLSGVDCSAVDGARFASFVELRELAMAGSRIGGTLPQYLRGLVNLEKLDLSANQITGSLPQWLFSLTKLRELDLSTCALSGEVPSAIGSLTSLEVLKLAVNDFSGEIPASIGFVNGLKILNLAECHFSFLPLSVILCEELEYVDISFNDIEGSPFLDEFLKLDHLQTLMMVGNRFAGTVSQDVIQSPQWKTWNAAQLICPQQQGYGFVNCK